MVYFLFIVKSALKDLFKNKVRTFLTSLGILIGVASVVLLIALGLGLKEYIRTQFYNLGTNLVYVMRGKIFTQGGGFTGTAIGNVKFDEKDYLRLKKITTTEVVVPIFLKTATVQGDGKSESGNFYATTPEIFFTRNLEIDQGNLFTKANVDKKSKVVVLGPKIAEKLFSQKERALNRTVRIESQAYKVVGVLKLKGSGGFGTPDFDSFIYAPYKSAHVFNPDKIFTSFILKAKDEISIPTLKREAKEVMLRRYNADDISIADQAEFINTITSIFTALNSVLIGIGAVSLMVGGIGIMNIMYVSVTERIKEIGIRRALGATRRDILFQFLAESVFLSLIGGFVGLGLAFGVTLLIQRFFPARIDGTSMVIAVSVSSFIGIFFGVFPARKAANLSPMDAIRYE